MAGLLSMLGKAGQVGKKIVKSPSFAVGGGTAAAGYGLSKAGVLQFDPWGEKQSAYEQKLGEEFIKQEAYKRSQNKDQFGHGTYPATSTAPEEKQQKALDMAAPYIREWEQAGAKDSSQWLGMIDALYLHEDNFSKDNELGFAVAEFMRANNVNALDIDLRHHNQRRRRAELGDLPSTD